MMFEFDETWPHLPDGAFLMSHDIHWNRAFGNFVRKHRQTDHAARGFGIIKKDSRTTAAG
jgi:hypothetical protein